MWYRFLHCPLLLYTPSPVVLSDVDIPFNINTQPPGNPLIPLIGFCSSLQYFRLLPPIWSDWIRQHTSMKHLFLVLAKPIKHPFGSIDSLIRPIFWSTHSVNSLQWLTYSTSIRQLLYNWFWDHVLIMILTSFSF